MGKIFSYLKASKGAVFAIFVLLIIQASCDLSLPQYMSDIVDVGIQQGGIDHVAPEQMRKETWETLEMFMTDEEFGQVSQAYEENGEGIYVRQTDREKDLEELDQIFGLPMLAAEMAAESEEMDIQTIRQMLDAGVITKDQILQMRDQVAESLGDMGDSMIRQRAVLFVQDEYEAMGMDLGRIQMDYLWISGLKMILLSMLMMAASISVSLMAASSAR